MQNIDHKSRTILLCTIALFFAMSVSANEQVSSSLSSINQDITPIALTQDQFVKVQKLQENSGNLSVRWDQTDATPKWVRMTNLEMNWRSENYTDRAYQFLEEYGALYNIADPQQVLPIQQQEQDALGMTRVTLQQVYKDVPVFAGQLQWTVTALNWIDRMGRSDTVIP